MNSESYISDNMYRDISGVTGGGQSAPQRLSAGKFLATKQEKWGKERK